MDVSVSINGGRVPAGRVTRFRIGQSAIFEKNRLAIFKYLILSKHIFIGCLVPYFSSCEAEQ